MNEQCLHERRQFADELLRAADRHALAAQKMATYLNNLSLQAVPKKRLMQDKNYCTLITQLHETQTERDFAAARLARFEFTTMGKPYLRLVG